MACKRSQVRHIDIEETPVVDNMPPRPNPPVFHYNPQGVFVYVPKVGTYGEQGYEEPKFELRVEATICLCEDNEGSDPVKYQAVCDDNENYTSEWLTSRATSVLIREINLVGIEASFTGVADGVFTFGCTPGDTEVGDKVQFNGIELSDCLCTVSEVGSDYICVDMGNDYYTGLTAGLEFYNLTKIYTAADWTLETPVNNYQFGARAKDSASPTNNIGKIGTLVAVEAPTEWICDIVEAMGGIAF